MLSHLGDIVLYISKNFISHISTIRRKINNSRILEEGLPLFGNHTATGFWHLKCPKVSNLGQIAGLTHSTSLNIHSTVKNLEMYYN